MLNSSNYSDIAAGQPINPLLATKLLVSFIYALIKEEQCRVELLLL